MIRNAFQFLLYLFVFHVSASIAQTNTFRGKPVIPYQTPKCAIEKDSILQKEWIEKYKLDALLNSRRKALDFFNTLNTIAEPSTISWIGTDYTYYPDRNNQKKIFVLNGDIKTPIALGGKKWRLNTLQFIPQFKVRIFQNDPVHNDRSLPVRTPSYLPGGVWFFSFKNLWKRNEQDNTLKGKYFGIYLFHHSNGQDGTEFVDSTGKLNVYNGNFAEALVGEFIFGGVKEYYSSPAMKRGSTTTKIAKSKTQKLESSVNPDRLLYWKISFEWHEASYVTEQVFRNYHLYGKNRVNFQLGLSTIPTYIDLLYSSEKQAYVAVTPKQSKEAWRYILNMNYILDVPYNAGDLNRVTPVKPLDITKRLNLYATVYRRIPGAPNAGVFFQLGYYGSDNYNIYFQQSLWQCRFGLALAFFRYPKSGDNQEAVYLHAQ